MMLKNIKLNNGTQINRAEIPVKLQNGNLVLHYDGQGDVLGAYMVISFRDQQGYVSKRAGGTAPYCTLINLDSGQIAFEEHCSRVTTMGRVLAHLTRSYDKGIQPISRGQRIEVYKVGNYSLDINYNENDNIVG